jgi:hypothetical protein
MKVGRGVAVIWFGSPAVEVGDVYKVHLKASGKRSITVNTVVVEAIYNGPPAECPQNITWRFRTVPVFCHTVTESMMSQYCGFHSVCGMVQYPRFREPWGVEAQDCRAAKETARLQWAAKSFESPHPWDHHLALHLPERRPHG